MTMRFLGVWRALAISLLLVLALAAGTARPALAVRHHLYVGTITRITYPNGGHNGSLTIHSKTHNANFTFVIDNSTKFLRHGQGEPRTSFKVGSYVTVSYSPGPNGTMIAYHISLRH